jgi:hypothetical protein
MASAFSFGNSSASEEFTVKFEEWLSQKLKSTHNDKDVDVSIFTSYILSTLLEEDNTEEEKLNAIRPFLEELNEVKKNVDTISVGAPNLSTIPYHSVHYRFKLQFFSRSPSDFHLSKFESANRSAIILERINYKKMLALTGPESKSECSCIKREPYLAFKQ